MLFFMESYELILKRTEFKCEWNLKGLFIIPHMLCIPYEYNEVLPFDWSWILYLHPTSRPLGWGIRRVVDTRYGMYHRVKSIMHREHPKTQYIGIHQQYIIYNINVEIMYTYILFLDSRCVLGSSSAHMKSKKNRLMQQVSPHDETNPRRPVV